MQAKPNSAKRIVAFGGVWFFLLEVIVLELLRSINNNIVSAMDEQGREVVVVGKGIGYKATEGSTIAPEKIDKIYVMSNPNNTERLKELFACLPQEYIEVTDEIMTHAKKKLNKRLNEGAYFTLADHLNFAVLRMRQGMDFQNVLLAEVRRFYPAEFEIGIYALDLIKRRLGITMPVDEAASIALHIFNAEYDISVSDAFHSTLLLEEILAIVNRETGVNLDTQDYYCERFVTHLKYLTQRVMKKEHLSPKEDGLYTLLVENYPEEIRCAKVIAAYIKEKQQYVLSPGEVGSLAIHIRRIQA